MDMRKISGRRVEAAKLAACAGIGAVAGWVFLKQAPGTDGIAMGILAGLAFYGIYRLAMRFMARP
jgi:hypothetical protein